MLKRVSAAVAAAAVVAGTALLTSTPAHAFDWGCWQLQTNRGTATLQVYQGGSATLTGGWSGVAYNGGDSLDLNKGNEWFRAKVNPWFDGTYQKRGDYTAYLTTGNEAGQFTLTRC